MDIAMSMVIFTILVIFYLYLAAKVRFAMLSGWYFAGCIFLVVGMLLKLIPFDETAIVSRTVRDTMMSFIDVLAFASAIFACAYGGTLAARRAVQSQSQPSDVPESTETDHKRNV